MIIYDYNFYDFIGVSGAGGRWGACMAITLAMESVRLNLRGQLNGLFATINSSLLPPFVQDATKLEPLNGESGKFVTATFRQP